MSHRVSLVGVGILAFLGVLGLTASPLTAATIIVNSTADVLDPRDEHCTLREAVLAANTNVASGAGVGECGKGDPGSDHIVFANLVGSPDVYTLAIPPAGTNDALTGDLNITEDVIITGNFQTETIIDGNGLDRVFYIGSGIAVQIERVTIQHGSAFQGAGIANDGGDLTIRQTSILENSSGCGLPGCTVDGAGVWNRGTLTIERSTIAENLALCTTDTCLAIGGGITNASHGGILSLDRSVVFSNDAKCTGRGCNAAGGGIWNEGTVFLSRSVIQANNVGCDADGGLDCTASGGGIFSREGVASIGALIQSNRASCFSSPLQPSNCKAQGGGLYNGQAQMQVDGLVLENSVAASCVAGSTEACEALGGGIYNQGIFGLSGSTVSSNMASCLLPRDLCTARGGGLFSAPAHDTQGATVTASTFLANAAVSPFRASGGGVVTAGRLEVERSTFSLNFAFG
jgi:CSLREA domain-containing protein